MLTSALPDGFGDMSNLDFLDLKDNQFSGTLPGSTFSLDKIRILYLSNNNFVGTIPSNYGDSPVLRDLFLSGNDLTGTIPEIDSGKLQQLTEFTLQDNQLTGSMASSVCQLRTSGILEDLWTDCGPSANPRVECALPSCCSQCFPVTFR